MADQGTVKLSVPCGESPWCTVIIVCLHVPQVTIRIVAFRLKSSPMPCGSTTRFSLSFREVKELLAERGVTLSHEAVRLWCFKSGQAFAKKLRRRSGHPGDTWHLVPGGN